MKVSGSRLTPTPYHIKLEGSRRVGYRTVSIAGARDPIFIREVDQIIDGVRRRVEENFSDIPKENTGSSFTFMARTG